MPATRSTPTKRTTARGGAARSTENIWSKEERAAMQESARERKAAARRDPAEERAQGEADVRAKIAEMPADDGAMAARIHELITEAAPTLVPRTFYGMPAYSKDGKVICFFQAKSKFKVRYSTFGCQPDAHLDDGEMWPVAFAMIELTPRAEARIVEIVRKAIS
jgi:uncharacterized protein YdhG (YjbR/CyaY superfamily)